MTKALVTARKQGGRQFVKGQSGNPAGRPKKTPELIEVEELCRKHAPDAVGRLVEWMQSDNARASIAACTGILERGFGKPREYVEHTGRLAGGTTIQIGDLPPDQREQLRLILLGAKRPTTITDVEAEEVEEVEDE